MAEDKQKAYEAKQVAQAEAAQAKKRHQEEANSEVLVRIMGFDIPGSRNIGTGLTYIKGISWTISNAATLALKIPRSKKISELSKPEIQKIEEFLNKLPLPDFVKNRRSDPETGETGHFYGTNLDMKREFDIKKMKEMKSYKGIRHTSKLPVRGQRTRSHFRIKSQASGMKKKKEGAK